MTYDTQNAPAADGTTTGDMSGCNLQENGRSFTLPQGEPNVNPSPCVAGTYPSPLDAALDYVGRGFEVFPVNPEKKQSHKAEEYSGTKWGKTSDPDQVWKDWQKWPNANVGIATGQGSGFWAIDLDVKDNGLEAWKKFCGDLDLPQTVTVRTPSGGRHYWFRWPEEGDVFNSVRKLGPGIDVRGEGGIVVAPPSAKPDGRSYTFEPGLCPSEVEIAPAPEWLLSRVRAVTKRKRSSVPGEESCDHTPGRVARAATQHKLSPLVKRLLKRLEDAEEGTRNERLNKIAYSLGGYAHLMSDGGGECLETLLKIVSPWPDQEKTRETAERAFHDGRKEPMSLELSPDDLLLSHEDLADYAMQAGLGRDFVNVGEWGWLRWQDHTWVPAAHESVHAAVAKHLRSVVSEVDEVAAEAAERARANAGAGGNTGPRSPGRVWASANAKRITLGSIQSDKAVAMKLAAKNHKVAADFNADPLMLGTPGGVVDLRTGKMRDGRREDYISRAAKVSPTNETPQQWLDFLNRIFPDSPEVVEFLQRLAGYSLTGLTREEKFFFLHGTGRNGKGTFLETLLHIMGDYSAKASAEVFLSGPQSDNNQNDLAMIDGARLVWGSEIPAGMRWNTATIKDLTGGDTITAKLLYKDKYSYKPQFTVIIAGNTKPSVGNVDVAMRERMVLVPFEQTFGDGEADTKLKERLLEESGGILRWAIEGACKYLKDGLVIPEAIRRASTEYLDSEDIVAIFLDDCCVADEEAFVASSDLFSRYKVWAEQQGMKPVGQRTLIKMLAERGIENGRKGAARFSNVLGLRLKGEGGLPF